MGYQLSTGAIPAILRGETGQTFILQCTGARRAGARGAAGAPRRAATATLCSRSGTGRLRAVLLGPVLCSGRSVRHPPMPGRPQQPPCLAHGPCHVRLRTPPARPQAVPPLVPPHSTRSPPHARRAEEDAECAAAGAGALPHAAERRHPPILLHAGHPACWRCPQVGGGGGGGGGATAGCLLGGHRGLEGTAVWSAGSFGWGSSWARHPGGDGSWEGQRGGMTWGRDLRPAAPCCRCRQPTTTSHGSRR